MQHAIFKSEPASIKTDSLNISTHHLAFADGRTMTSAVRPSVAVAILGLLLLVNVAFGSPAVSEAQYKQAMKLLRNVCGPKSGLSKEVLDSVSNGSGLAPERPIKCYLACIMSTAQTLKNGKIDFKMMKTQAEKMLPPNMREPILAQVESCQQFGVGTDNCDVAYDFAICARDLDPEKFLVP